MNTMFTLLGYTEVTQIALAILCLFSIHSGCAVIENKSVFLELMTVNIVMRLLSWGGLKPI